jgi:hypothetical protein
MKSISEMSPLNNMHLFSHIVSILPHQPMSVHNCSGSYNWTMAALETGVKLKAQLVLLQEPTSKWGIRHPGYRLIWPQEGGNKPRTMVGVRTDGRLRVEYRSDLGQHSMGDVMVWMCDRNRGQNSSCQSI